MCFAGALRRSELVGLDVEHTAPAPDGLRLLVAHFKTDTQGQGAEVWLARGRAVETCPVAALRAWLDGAGITSGPLFRKVDRWGVVHDARLPPDAVRQVLARRARQAGVQGTLWVITHPLASGLDR